MKLLKVGSWEHLEQIPTVNVTSVQATFVLAILVHISEFSGKVIKARLRESQGNVEARSRQDRGNVKGR